MGSRHVDGQKFYFSDRSEVDAVTDSGNDVDAVETRLRQAAGLGASKDSAISRDRGFLADLGCGARVRIDHIDGRYVGSIGLHLQRLTPEAAEAVIHFLRSRNEPVN